MEIILLIFNPLPALEFSLLTIYMITASAAMEVAVVTNKHKRYDKWEILLKLYPNENKRN